MNLPFTFDRILIKLFVFGNSLDGKSSYFTPLFEVCVLRKFVRSNAASNVNHHIYWLVLGLEAHCSKIFLNRF